MGKRMLVQQLPDRKNNFRIWVDQIRSSKTYQRVPSKPLIESVYIHKSAKKSINWNYIQSNSRDKYLEKMGLLEEIRLRKIENETVNLFYTPRYAYSAVAGSK